jgi:hypothetical protein
MKTLDILKFSAFSDKSDLCKATADIYDQLLQLSRKKECTIVSRVELYEEGGKVKVLLKFRGNNYYQSREKCLNEIIKDVIGFLKNEGAYRLLKYFARTIHKHFQLKHNKSGYMLEIRTIVGLYFRGQIVPEYAVWMTSDIVELSGYALKADNLVHDDRDTYYEDDEIGEPPPKRERIEYFMKYFKKRGHIEYNKLYNKILKLRGENKKKYLDIEFNIRTNAVIETLNELYLMIRTTYPNFDINKNIKSMKFVEKRPEKISFSLLRRKQNARCPSEWFMKNYIAGGTEGPVYGTCCDKDCEYVTKVVTFKSPKKPSSGDDDIKEYYKEYVTEKDFIDNCKRVKKVWMEFFKEGLAPRLFEMRIEKGAKKYPNEIQPYCTFVSEKMNKDAGDIIDKLIKKEEWRLLERFYTQIFLLIKKAHDKRLVHGDCHSGNIMIKADEGLFKDLEKLIEELETGSKKVKMVFIDFGGSISYKFKRKEILDMILYQAGIGIEDMLKKLKCFKMVGMEDLSHDEIMRAIEYYDYHEAVRDILTGYKNRNVLNILKMFFSEMKKLKTKCKTPELEKYRH